MHEPESDRLSEFIVNSTYPGLAKACVAFATACNRLDPSYIEECLAEEAIYGSQETVEDLTGKAVISEYIQAKFDTIREGGLACRVRAELVLDPIDRKPCVLLYQRTSNYEEGLGKIAGYVELKIDSAGRISNVFLVSVAPSPRECTTTGLFPGLTADQTARDRKAPRLLIPKDAPLILRLFVLPDVPLCAEMERSVKAVCDKRSKWRTVTIPVDPDPHASLGLDRYVVVGFPTLIVEHDGDEVCRMEGYRTPGAIEMRINELSTST